MAKFYTTTVEPFEIDGDTLVIHGGFGFHGDNIDYKKLIELLDQFEITQKSEHFRSTPPPASLE